MKYLKVFTSFCEDTQMLSDAEMGRLFRVMLNYAQNPDESPELRGSERFVWPVAKRWIDDQRVSYEHQCAVNKKTATNRYESLQVVTNRDKSKSKNIKEISSKEDTKKERFAPPTLEDVKSYAKASGLTVNPETFFHYFDEGGWKDANGKRVRNWKQKMITWSSHEKTSKAPKRMGINAPYEQHKLPDSEFDAMFDGWESLGE